jgi:hypothetical protein
MARNSFRAVGTGYFQFAGVTTRAIGISGIIGTSRPNHRQTMMKIFQFDGFSPLLVGINPASLSQFDIR